MGALHHKITSLYIIINLYVSVAFEEVRVIGYNDKKFPYLPDIEYLDYQEVKEKWLENVLRDIGYYLRNHKFNEWDRRYYNNSSSSSTGFYATFPIPCLSSIHWEVHKNCQKDFFKCISYLHSVIKTAPFTRIDDITTVLNNKPFLGNVTILENQNNECKKALLYSEKTGLPFDDPKEKFYWRTSASYYMCSYTMKGIPALSMLGESCDNFASCLDDTFGNRNHDPRSDDKLSFACAMYSFCPDPCCPLKHVQNLSECYNSKLNPCYIENAQNNDVTYRQCRFEREDNQNLEQMIENKWNISCYCQQKGFKWESQFGMCVDINECITKQHKCDLKTENCLNLPGTYHCVCKWGYTYDKIRKKCTENNRLQLPMVRQQGEETRYFNILEKLVSFIEYFTS